MKRLISRPITHREIPLQVGLNFNEYEKNIIYDGEIENQKSYPEYDFEKPIDNMEWRLKDNK